MLPAYTALLRDFATHVGLDPGILAQTQEVVMAGIAIGLAHEGDEHGGDLLYFADLGAPSPPRALPVYRALLEANHFWVGTSGATLALQPDTGRVICCGSMGVTGAVGTDLAVRLDAFISTLLFWQQYVSDELPQAPCLPAYPMLLGA
jgi:hypothetical protein